MTQEQLTKLTKAFSDEQLSVKVQSVSKNKDKAMLIVYLQHTDVATRLDEVDPSWEFRMDTPQVITIKGFNGPEQLIQCHGSLAVAGVRRDNVGEGDDPKSAASDCFKRCAMLFGVGRSLYDQGKTWVPYNEVTDKYKSFSMKDVRRYNER